MSFLSPTLTPRAFHAAHKFKANLPPPLRSFHTSHVTMQSATPPLQISQGEDAEAVREQAAALVQGGRWRVCNEGRGVEREFRFKGFKVTWVEHRCVFDAAVGIHERHRCRVSEAEPPSRVVERLQHHAHPLDDAQASRALQQGHAYGAVPAVLAVPSDKLRRLYTSYLGRLAVGSDTSSVSGDGSAITGTVEDLPTSSTRSCLDMAMCRSRSSHGREDGEFHQHTIIVTFLFERSAWGTHAVSIGERNSDVQTGQQPQHSATRRAFAVFQVLKWVEIKSLQRTANREQK
nr:hypothetical protein CFP56_21898 [Quercus suber]